jgi:hypothetical protein
MIDQAPLTGVTSHHEVEVNTKYCVSVENGDGGAHASWDDGVFHVEADQDGMGFWVPPSFGKVCVRAVIPGHPAYPGRLVPVLADRLA